MQAEGTLTICTGNLLTGLGDNINMLEKKYERLSYYSCRSVM